MSGERRASYRAPVAAVEGELLVKGSRFRAVVSPATTEDEARDRLDELRRRFAGATHVCWAWRLGAAPLERSADAGEPSGTAGAPILRALAAAGVADALAVVARWYGGVKLGRGGLIRAYGGATRAALAGLATTERVPTRRLVVELPYGLQGAVRRLLDPPAVTLAGQRAGERLELDLRVSEEQLARVEESLRDLGLAPRPHDENEP